MQKFDAYYQKAEQWLIDLSDNGPPNLESYGSIFGKIEALLESSNASMHPDLRLPDTDGLDLGSKASTSNSRPLNATFGRRLNASSLCIHQETQSTPSLTVVKPPAASNLTNIERSKILPDRPILPPLCISKTYNLSSDSSKKLHEIIGTLNDYANTLEFVGQISEAQRTRRIVIFSAIPLFFLSEFIEEIDSPLTKGTNILANADATKEALAIDMTEVFRKLSEASNSLERRLVDWGVMMEEQLSATLSREPSSSLEAGALYLARTYENWKGLLIMAGGLILLTSIAGDFGSVKTFWGVNSSLLAIANTIGVAGEVAQTHKSVVEHSHGKVQDFMFPSTGSLVRNFRDILKTVDPKDPKWYEAASTRWNELANEVNLMGQVLSTWRLEGGAGAAATV